MHGIIGGIWMRSVVLGAWFGQWLWRSPLGFYLLFALMITAPVQIVSGCLVLASLIIPALAGGTRLLQDYDLDEAIVQALELVALP